MPVRPFFETSVLSIPQNGKLYIPVELDFTVNASSEIDLMQELMQVGGIGFVQGIFIDQSQNVDNLTLTFHNLSNQGFRLVMPGKIQAWQPILLPVGSAAFTATSVVAAARLVQIHLVNFPVMPLMWNVP